MRNLADETLARVLIAAKRTAPNAPKASAPPDLVEYTADVAAPGAPAAPATAGAAGGELLEPAPAGDVPPIGESGFDMGSVLQGADAFDSLTRGLGK